MEIKTAEQILREVLIEEGIEHGEEYIDSYGAIDAVQIAMIRFAKQFIDLAAKEIWEQSYLAEKNYNKKIILDIKQLIK